MIDSADLRLVLGVVDRRRNIMFEQPLVDGPPRQLAVIPDTDDLCCAG